MFITRVLTFFKDTWILYIILVAVPYIIFFGFRKKSRGSVKFSSIEKFKRIKPGLKYKLRHIPVFIRCLTVILLILTAARPRKGNEIKKQITKGVAIQMVVDKSGSMRQVMNFDNKQLTRLDVVKKVFSEFVSGKLSADGHGRDNDLIGITSFSGMVEFNCPLTLEHGNFDQFLNGIKIYDYEKVLRNNRSSMSSQELQQFRNYAEVAMSTAIGDALYYTVLKMIEADQYYKKNSADNYTIKSKVIILLTDGQNTYGKFSPSAGAELAKANGVKVYTIGIGSSRGGQYINDPIFGRIFVGGRGQEVDAATLKNIAEVTGGKFYLADDGEALRKIYRDIDRMEKTKIEDSTYLEYNELYRYFLIPALILIVIEIILSSTIFRRLP